MLYRFKDRYRRFVFDRMVNGILHREPARLNPDSGVMVLTQLQHKDVRMFLVACKSFAAKIPVARVGIVSDGTLTEDDVRLLSNHIPGATFYQLTEFRSAQCPAGACWERLLAIASLVENYYVIQLDGDTLTLEDLGEVEECIRSNTSFTLGTVDGQSIEPMAVSADAAKAMRGDDPIHIQVLAESNFDQLPDCASLRYVRGCAGFAGFAKGSFSRNRVESLSIAIERVVGKRWHEWGSEQVLSNLIVSNSPAATVLPHPKYSSCETLDRVRPAFIHFIGYCRFNRGRYGRLAKSVIETLP